jgi:hypothetical protein
MRRGLLGLLGLAALAFLPTCSSDEITTTPDQDGATDTTQATGSADDGATVGDTISVHGELEPELEIAVTVLSIVDPAKADKFLKAEEGSR